MASSTAEASRGVLDLRSGQDLDDRGNRSLQLRWLDNCRLERPDDQDRFRGVWRLDERDGQPVGLGDLTRRPTPVEVRRVEPFQADREPDGSAHRGSRSAGSRCVPPARTNDPLLAVLSDLHDNLVKRYGHALAAQLLLALIQYASEQDRRTAVQVIFMSK